MRSPNNVEGFVGKNGWDSFVGCYFIYWWFRPIARRTGSEWLVRAILLFGFGFGLLTSFMWQDFEGEILNFATMGYCSWFFWKIAKEWEEIVDRIGNLDSEAGPGSLPFELLVLLRSTVRLRGYFILVLVLFTPVGLISPSKAIVPNVAYNATAISALYGMTCFVPRRKRKSRVLVKIRSLRTPVIVPTPAPVV